MNKLFIYILELNIAITIFYLAYLLIFRRDSNFSTKRGFLFIAMIISLIIPAVNFSISSSSGHYTAPLLSLDEIIINAGSAYTTQGPLFDVMNIIKLTYLLITSILILKFVYNIFKILREILRSETQEVNGILIRANETLHASSFFNMIFIDPKQIPESGIQHILDHEKYHVKLKHSFDRMLAECLITIGWFNPVNWILRRSVIVNHEYQADKQVIEQGTDHISYQLSILNQYVGCASLSNQFSSQIKNRINMLNKNYKKGSFWKGLMLIPVSAILFFFISCSNEAETDQVLKNETVPVEEEIFYIVEQMPQWPGGGDLALEMRKFIAKNLKYPEIALANGIEGKVFIHLLVKSNGDIVIPKPSQLPPEKAENGNENEVIVVAYRPINEGDPLPEEEYIKAFKDEGKRVIELIPDVIPGKQRGKNVNVIFTMPLTFKLQ